MMLTYLLLDIIFIAAVGGLLQLWRGTDWRRSGLTALILCIMTVVFDSLIIKYGIVDYDGAKIMGLRIGLAPLEDFGYPLLAAVLVPALWRRFRLQTLKKEKHDVTKNS